MLTLRCPYGTLHLTLRCPYGTLHRLNITVPVHCTEYLLIALENPFCLNFDYIVNHYGNVHLQYTLQKCNMFAYVLNTQTEVNTVNKFELRGV